MKIGIGKILVGMGVLVLMVGKLWVDLPNGNLAVHFFSIGQGDAILVETPENFRILIDGGPDNSILEKLGGTLAFDQKKIDLMILTHPHADHMNGLVEVLEKMEVETVLVTGVNYGGLAYEKFWELVAEKGVEVIYVNGVNDWRVGSVLIDLLYPLRSIQGEEFENVNNSSVSLRVIFGQQKIFFSGDLEKEGEEELLASGARLGAEVYKAAHHGSRTSSTEEFLARIGMEIAVISCGLDNKFKHPAAETLDKLWRAGATVYRTDLDGDVRLEMDGADSLQVYTSNFGT
ncbi:MAG: ComEC/Rec2 family competence protein [Candidatus Altimarinota bacterium]